MADRILLNKLGEVVRNVQEDEDYQLQPGESFASPEQVFGSERQDRINEMLRESAQAKVDRLAEKHGLGGNTAPAPAPAQAFNPVEETKETKAKSK